jgi:hypothetical protein
MSIAVFADKRPIEPKIFTLDASQVRDNLYLPLVYTDSIRFLGLKPAESTDALVACELFTTRLGEKPDYEALSYTWGEPIFSRSIHLPQGGFNITENLGSTL